MSAEEASATSRPGTWLKSGYGSAEIGLTAIEVMLQVYLLELYVSAGLSPTLAGIALAVAVLWDAVSDPLMGVVSDRTPARSARGKRLPYVGIGVPMGGLAFYYLFSPTGGASEAMLFWRLLLWYLLLNTAMTLVIVPYLALINDLAKRAADRAGFFGWRLVFSGGGLIVGLSIPSLIAAAAGYDLEKGGSDLLLQNRSAASVWIAIACVVTAAFAVAAVWGASGRARAQEGASGRAPFRATLRAALGSRAFRYVVLAFVFIALGRAVNASLALIFYKGTLQFGDSEVAVALIGLSLTVMAATPLWVLVSKRFDKRGLCFWGSVALTGLTAVVYPLMPPDRIGPVIFIVVAGGIAASSVVLLESLFSDVVESDGEETGKELSGSYYGLWRMATKLARAGGLAVSGLFLGLIGYEEGVVEQGRLVYRSVAWAFGPGVAVFFGLGTWFVWLELRRSRREAR